MATTRIDANNRTVAPDLWATVPITKIMTFDGGEANDPGDQSGTGNPATLFNVTGTVLVGVLAVCTTTLTGAAATLEVGIAGNTAGLIAQTTGTDIDVGEIWHDASPDSGIELSSVVPWRILANGANIIQTVGTADITAGVIQYLAFWYPLSSDADLTAA